MEITPQALWQEIRDAQELRGKYLDTYRERLLKWVGNRFRNDWKTKPQLENYQHSYIAFMLPQLVFDRPVVDVAPLADARDTATADGMAAMINHFVKCSRYKQTVLKPMARDLLLGWGVTYKALDLAGDGAGRGLPVTCKPIPIGDYVCDAHCFGYNARRWEGHSFEKKKSEILADPTYAGVDPAVIEGLQENSDDKKRDDLPVEPPARGNRKDTVTLWQLYVREEGRVITMAQAGGPIILRDEAYDGPKNGPYTMWGVYEVPGQVYPLPPLGATEEQSDDLNDHAYAASKSAKTHKRFAVGRLGKGDDAKAVKDVKSGQLILLGDPQGITDMEIGGMSPQQSEILGLLRERLDRNLGFSDAQRGKANSNTATANTLAQNNSDLRTGFILSCLTDCAEEDLAAVGWFFYNKDSIVADMAIEDRQTGQMKSVTFYGGQTDPQDLEQLIGAGMVDPSARYGADREWTDYHLRIQVESMTKVADPIRQKRAQDEMTMAFQFSTLLVQAYGPQAPLVGINWKQLWRRYGRAFNEPNYEAVVFTPAFDQMVSPDPLAGPMGMMMQAGMVGEPGGQQPPGVPAAIPPGGASPQPSPSNAPASFPGLLANASAGVGASAY